jgi:hypothetical protein
MVKLLQEILTCLIRNATKDVVLDIQGVFEMRAKVLITSYWLHVELGKNI